MRSKAFARTKEQLATGSLPCAVGGAQVAKVYQIEISRGGRGMDADDSHRLVARVSLGKKSMLFRLGNDPVERTGAIDELSYRIQHEKGKAGQRFIFNLRICRCIAGVALDELAIDMCFECKGSGVVRDHDVKNLEGRQPMRVCPSCAGAKRHRFNEDERVMNLGKEWAFQNGGEAEQDGPIIAEELRKEKRLREMLYMIEYAKSELLICERVVTEETAKMLERL